MKYSLIAAFLKLLAQYKAKLSIQQYKTLKGQAINGDVIGAQKGLLKLISN
jgi:hypothetical protein